MRTIKHATLQFGSIFVPVGVATAAKREEVKFRTLHVDCGHPINKVDMCKQCDMSLSSEDLVKGYEVAKDTFIVVDEDTMGKILVARDSVIELLKFVDREDIDATMIERSYFLTPNKSLHRPYELLVSALDEKGVVGIGKTTLWGKEFPVAVETSGGALMLRYLFFADEIRSGAEIGATLKYDVSMDELTFLGQWIDHKRGSVTVEDLTNESRIKTLELIEQLAGGSEVSAPDPVKPEPVTINMLDELKSMLSVVK